MDFIHDFINSNILYGDDMINAAGVNKIYNDIGEALFNKISPQTIARPRKTPKHSETLKSITHSIKSNNGITLAYLNSYSGFSKSSIGDCIRTLTEKGFIKKENDKTKTGQPVTYFWIGEA
ncbi:MAG: hypothetical protein Unbinned5350contig1004_13 [Prokaryotic dsDNA virus sp.]|nr:MAG: hypothetical protein Unbinned5350contig1004_13 [Prokaryotic dsDNA virus sp.]